MNTAIAVAGGLGSIAAFGIAVVAIVRAIARQVSASKANEAATRANTEALVGLSDKINHIDSTVTQHGERIARLEGWRAGGGRRTS